MSIIEEPSKLSNKQLLAFFAMQIGMFMAILDIQIVASSLSAISSGLSTDTEELAWVQTSYLMAEVVIIPMSGFIARCFSTRISYFIAVCGFTLMSALCSIAWNIESMIIFRAFQGFFGGAMIPTVFSIIFTAFPLKQRAMVTTITGLVVTIAPTCGPIVGGYITEISSWHFMFLINIVPGIFVSTTVFLYGYFDKPNYNLLRNFDYIGVLLMIFSLAALQYVLEEGNRKGWLEDNSILFLSISLFISFIALLIREVKFVNPILDFSAFRDKNFTFSCIFSFIIGIGLYGSVYLLPLFLFYISGYNTVQIGTTMLIGGISQFISAPIAGMLSGKLDPRLMLGFGLGAFGLGSYLNAVLTIDSKIWEFLVPQIFKGGSLMFCFIPINNLALGTLDKDKVQTASGLYNLTRNLGGAVGIAIIGTIIQRKTAIFSQYLNEGISSTSPKGDHVLEQLTQILDGQVINVEKGVMFLLENNVSRNAFVLAINDMFIIISLLFFCAMLLLPLTNPVKKLDIGSH